MPDDDRFSRDDASFRRGREVLRAAANPAYAAELERQDRDREREEEEARKPVIVKAALIERIGGASPLAVVHIREARAVRGTDKALLVDTPAFDRTVWVPRSPKCLLRESEIQQVGDRGVLSISPWFAAKLGIVGAAVAAPPGPLPAPPATPLKEP